MVEVAFLTARQGKPTSGRFVYKSRSSREWYWQCDLCERTSVGITQHLAWVSAFQGALTHERTCLYVNYYNRSFPDKEVRFD